jgi:CubicO group peptidase (beta-lactamase class C family)
MVKRSLPHEGYETPGRFATRSVGFAGRLAFRDDGSYSPDEEDDPGRRATTMSFCGRLALVAILVAPVAQAQSERVWPTQGWSTASPGDEGVDVSILDAFDRELASGAHGYVDGMLVIRHGRIVYEKSYEHGPDYDRLFAAMKDSRPGIYNYYDPGWHPWYQKGPLHTMQSVSKSVTSALVGIAIGSEKIPGVGVEIRPYFVGFRFPTDHRWRAVTLRHLLTMTSGIDWDESKVSYTDPGNSCARMEGSPDWVQFVLDQPMAADPGTAFVYNSGATELLGEILVKATGKDPDAYAAEHLFHPLGIANWFWKKTPAGLSDTEGGLYLTARDLAKIGYLYLNDGVWEAQRILPEGWVQESTAEAVNPTGKESGSRYGYQWWLTPYEGESDSHAYAPTCRGYGGQYLFVVPEYDVVAVFTGWNIYDHRPLDPQMALERVIASVRPPVKASSAAPRRPR